MGAILNGMALVKVRAFGSGFLIFSDYGRMPIRLAAIMEIPVIYVFTHDSIGVGEDGPTHQPIEQLRLAAGDPRPDRAPPRATPTRWSRPGRSSCSSITSRRPSSSRARTCPTLDRTKYAPAVGPGQGRLRPRRCARRQARRVLLWPPAARWRSASQAFEQLKAEGIQVPRGQHAFVGAVRRPGREPIAIRYCRPTSRLGSRSSRRRSLAGRSTSELTGQSIGMRSFGASAPLKDLQREFGFTVERVVDAAKAQLGKVST